MKTSLNQTQSRYFIEKLSRQVLLPVQILILAGGTMISHAQTQIIKANSYTSLTTGSDWSGGATPGSANIAVWNSTAGTPALEALGANTNWEGIQIANPGGPVTVGFDGNSLTNGAIGVVGLIGINMTNATQSLTLSNNLVVNGVQNWNVASGQTLSVLGPLTYTPSSALRINLADSTANVYVTNGNPSQLLGNATNMANGYFATLNDTDMVGLVSGGPGLQVVGGSTLGIYTINAATGATPTDNGNFAVADITTNVTGTFGWRISGSFSWGVAYLNQPQSDAASTVAYNGVIYPAWQILHSSGRNLNIGTILITTNVGNSAVWDNSGGLSVLGAGGPTNAGSDLRIFQNNPAAPLILANTLHAASTGANIIKMGPGLVSLQAACGDNANTKTLRVYEGTFEVDNGGSLILTPVNVYGGIFALTAPDSAVSAASPITVFSGATNNIIVNANGAQVVTTNLMLNAGSSIQFVYSNGVAPSATTAPLSVTAANSVLTLNSTVNLNVVCGSLSPGQFPLIKYTGTPGGAGFAALNLNFMPPHVSGYLSNNVANSSIDLVVTNVAQPISWNTASGIWDVGTTANWVLPSGPTTTYQQNGPLGDNVLFSDSAAGGTVTLSTNVFPSSVTVNNANSAYTISGSGSITGLGSFIKTGSGTVTLSTINSFTGGISMNGGTVVFSSLANLGVNNINFSGGALQYNGNTDDISTRTVTLNTGGGTINTAGQTVNYAHPIGTGNAGGLSKAGPGTLTLNGTNTYHGNTMVSQGTLALGANTFLPNSAAIVVNSGAVLDTAVSGVNLSLSSVANQTLEGAGQVNGVVTAPSSTTIIPANSGVTGTLSVNGGLNISGGTLNMTVAPTSNDVIAVTGPLAINSGSLQLNFIGTLPLGRYVIMTYSGSLSGGVGNIPPPISPQLNTSATLDSSVPNQIALVLAFSDTNALVWPGTGSTWDTTSADWLNVLNAAPWVFTNGDTVIFNDSETGGNVSPSLTASLEPKSIIVSNTVVPVYTFVNGGGSIGGTGSLTKDGTGTLIMNTLNAYTGPTTISHGTLQVGSGGPGDIGTGNVTNNGALVFAEGDGASHNVDGVISGTGSLTVNTTNSSTVILTNNNTYSGLTTISGGTLQVGVGGASGSLGSNNAITDNGELLLDKSGAVAFGANISGSGALADEGSATITLNGILTYQGDTSISNGLVKITANNQLPNQNSVVGSTGQFNLDNGAASAGTFDMSGFNVTINALSGQSNNIDAMITNSSTATGTTNVLSILNTATTTFNGIIADHGATGARIALLVTGPGTLTLNPSTNAPNGIPQLTPGVNAFGGGIIISNSTLALGTPALNGIVNPAQNLLAAGTGSITLLGTNAELIMAGYTGSTVPTYTNMIDTLIVPAGQTGTLALVQRGTENGALLGGGVLNILETYARGGIGGNWSAFTGQLVLSGATTGGDIGFADTNGLPNASIIMTTNVLFHAGDLLFGQGGINGYPTNITLPIGALAGGDSSDTISGLETGANANDGGSSVTLEIGGLNTSTTYGGGIIDTNSLLKVGTGTFTLDSGSAFTTNVTSGFGSVTNIGYGTNFITYFGTTTVSNGTLALVAPVVLTNSITVTLAAPNAVLDASAMGYISNLSTALPDGLTQELVTNSIFEVVSGQTLGGVGTLNGFLQADTGSIFNPGLPTGAFNVTSNATLSGTINMNLDNTNTATSSELVTPAITASGVTLVVTNLGPGLINNTTYTLFSQPVPLSSFNSITLPATDPTGTTNYTWQTNLAVNGSITLTAGGLLVQSINPNPTNIVFSISSGNLVLTWPADHTGWTLQAETNSLAVGLRTNDWVNVANSTTTNQVTIPRDPKNPTVFYRLTFTIP
jgi:autotransporter-associated beta strand protein